MLLDSPEAFGGSYEEELQYSEEQWRNYLIEAIFEKRTILVFFLKNDKVVGMAGAKFDLTQKKSHKANLFSVYVLPSYRGLGIGKVLIANIFKKVKTKSIKKIEAIVGTNQLSAIRLYSQFNFLIEGLLKNYWLVNDKPIDVYAMGLNTDLIFKNRFLV